MFKKSIGKKCDNSECTLRDQLQEDGLVICPECGSNLVNVLVANRRAQAAAAVGLALVGAVVAFVAYGYVVKALGPLQLVQLLLRRMEISDSIQSTASSDWVVGKVRFYNAAGPLPGARGEFLHEVKEGRQTATLRDHLAANTMISFDVRPATPAVSSLYLLHTDGQQARVLFAADQALGAPAVGAISMKDNSGKEQGIGLVGSNTEHFVLIAARKSLSSLAELKTKAAARGVGEAGLADADLNAAVAPLEHDSDAYVLHVYIPHS